MKQTTFCYCPQCRNELCANENFVSDDGETVIYCCSQCKHVSQWFFGAPVPILISQRPDHEPSPRNCTCPLGAPLNILTGRCVVCGLPRENVP